MQEMLGMLPDEMEQFISSLGETALSGAPAREVDLQEGGHRSRADDRSFGAVSSAPVSTCPDHAPVRPRDDFGGRRDGQVSPGSFRRRVYRVRDYPRRGADDAVRLEPGRLRARLRLLRDGEPRPYEEPDLRRDRRPGAGRRRTTSGNTAARLPISSSWGWGSRCSTTNRSPGRCRSSCRTGGFHSRGGT